MNAPINICDECESEYYAQASKMQSLCPECAHLLYGYEKCEHKFRDGKCVYCGWDGGKSEFLASLRKQNEELS